MKFISWNIDSLNAALTGTSERAELTRKVLTKIVEEDADIIAIEETKLPENGMNGKQKEALEDFFKDYDYSYISSRKIARKGYAGTMALYKKGLTVNVEYPEIGAPGTMDLEGRMITLELPDFYFNLVYTPNSGGELARLSDRQMWDSKYADYTKLSQFDGQNPKVTTQAGTNYIDYKKEIPSGVSVTDYESSPECFMAIQNKTADVCILDKTTAQSALATMSGLKVLDLDKSDDFVAPKDSPNDCCIAFREGDKRRDEVNKAMKELGWTTDNKGKFDKLMDEMVKLQPSSN